MLINLNRQILICICISIQLLNAQDLHVTNYNFAKPYFNPAEVGSFSGTIRLGGIYREQFSNFIHKPYQTVLFYMDSPVSNGLRPSHWIGSGLQLSLDRAGDLVVQNIGIMGSLSYHIGLDAKYKNVIALGFQFGNIQRSVNPNRAVFQDQYEGSLGASKDLHFIQDYKDNYQDYNVGLKFTHKLSSYSNFDAGLAVLHLAQPNIRFKDGQIDNPIYRRINLNASYGIDLSEEMSLTPVLYFSKYSNAYNTSVQLLWDYRFFEKSDKKQKIKIPKDYQISLGVGYRIQDAIQFIVGGIYKQWKFGFAYDMTVSSASQFDNYYGAYEVGISRILSYPKKPKVVSKFYCPRF